MRDGVWYGRDGEKKSIVKITVEKGKIHKIDIKQGEPKSFGSYDGDITRTRKRFISTSTASTPAGPPTPPWATFMHCFV